MPRWYYSTNGKAEGPVQADVLIEGLKAGRFTLIDLVFCEGESAWKTFGEVPEFREAFNAIPVFVPPPPPPPPPVQVQVQVQEPVFEIDQTVAAKTAVFEPDTLAVVSATVSTTAAATAAATQPVFIAPSHTVSAFQKPEVGWPSDWHLSSSWIVLRQRSDGSGYDQDGPFSAEYIIECIGNGKIEYSQYCWKPGYTRWFRIGNLPEFDRRKRDRENDQVNQIVPVPAITESLPALSREELLANVDRLKRSNDASEKAPPEAEGPNLVEAKAPTAKAVPVVATINYESSIADSPIIDADSFRASKSTPASAQHAMIQRKKSPTVLRFGVAFALALVAVLALIQFVSVKHRDPASTGERSVPKKKVDSRPTKAKLVEQETSATDSVGTAAAATASAVSTSSTTRNASVLEIMPLKLETASPSLAFQTDAGPDDKIKVQLKAHTGEILKYGSYSKAFEVGRSGGELPTLDLAAQGLPPGTYIVEASVGTVQTSLQIFVGQKNPAFLSSLENHIKTLSFRQQSERAALFYGSAKLEALVKELISGSQALKDQPLKWKRTFAVWKGTAREATLPVLALSRAPSVETTYPEQLAAFQTAIEKLASQANAIDEAMGQQRDVASSGLDDLTSEFARIREASAKLSGRPQASN